MTISAVARITSDHSRIRFRHRPCAALRVAGDYELADRIDSCEHRRWCSSLWCNSCKTRFARNLQARIWDHLIERGDTTDRNLRWLTVLFSLTQPDAVEVAMGVAEAKKEFEAFRRKFGFWMQGVYELQLIDSASTIQVGKKRTYEDMGALAGNLQVLVHCHVLIDTCGLADASIVKWLSDRLPGYRRVWLERTWQGQDIERKCKNISRYCFKGQRCFKLGEDHDGPIEIDFTDDQLAMCIRLYHNVAFNGIKNLLISSCGDRRATVVAKLKDTISTPVLPTNTAALPPP